MFSPVARDTTIHSVLSVATQLGWHITLVDVETAFLNAKLEEEIYIERPDSYKGKGNG